MDMDRDEQVIFFKDLLFAVLYQWKKILAAALALAVLLGGFAALRNSDDEQDRLIEEKYQKDLEQYRVEKTALEQTIEDMEEKVRAQQAYMENSLLMGLDPYSFYEASMDLYIDTDYQINPGQSFQNPDHTEAVISAYEIMLGGEHMLSVLSKDTQIEQKYLKEIITVVCIRDDAAYTQVIRVRIRHQQQKTAEHLLALMQEDLPRIGRLVTQSVGKHTADVISTGCSTCVDLTLADTQKQATDRMSELTDALAKTNKTLANLQEPMKAATSGNQALKYAVLGAAVGVFLVAAVAVLTHITGGKVYSMRTLEARTDIRVLLTLAAKQAHGVDRRLRKLEGRPLERDAAAMQLASATIGNYCGSGKRLLITGDLDRETIQSLIQGLELGNVSVTVCGSLLRDAEAARMLSQCDGVLLAEQCGVSRYDHIARTCSHIQQLDAKLLGCLLFE